MRYVGFGILAFVGCTSSVQVLDTAVPVPAMRIDTVYVFDTDRVFVESPCDTGAILDLLCKGEASGTTDGVAWKFKYDKVARENQILGVKVRRLADSVHILVNKPATTVELTQAQKQYISELESNQEKHGFWYFVQFGIACAFAGAVLLSAALIFAKFKAFFGM